MADDDAATCCCSCEPRSIAGDARQISEPIASTSLLPCPSPLLDRATGVALDLPAQLLPADRRQSKQRPTTNFGDIHSSQELDSPTIQAKAKNELRGHSQQLRAAAS